MDRIKKLEDCKIPGGYVMLEFFSKAKEAGIDIPEGVERDPDDIYSVVIAVGNNCKRLAVGDVVYMIQGAPRGFEYEGREIGLVYEDVCLFAASKENISNNPVYNQVETIKIEKEDGE